MSERSEPKELAVAGLSYPYRVTSESVGEMKTRYTLYRCDVVVTYVETRYLSETDAAGEALRQYAALYESVRVKMLAEYETIKELMERDEAR